MDGGQAAVKRRRWVIALGSLAGGICVILGACLAIGVLYKPSPEQLVTRTARAATRAVTKTPTLTRTTRPTKTTIPTRTPTATKTPRPTRTPVPSTSTPRPTVVPATSTSAAVVPVAPAAATHTPMPAGTDTPVPTPAPASWRCPGDISGAAFVGSVESDKFHYPGCQHAKKILPENRICFGSRQGALDAGYVPCGVCEP